LTLHSLQIQEDERQRLSQELHDELGQSLTAVKVMAVAAKQQPSEVVAIADTIVGICDHLITVVRSMMRNLHPLVLSELGLKATLEDLVNYWAARQPKLSITIRCSDAVDDLEPKLCIQIFRVVQECITNIIRHSEATQASVILAIAQVKGRHILTLHVLDNGQGCTEAKIKAGFGFLGVRERVKSLGGQLELNAELGQGVNIRASIPLS